MTGIRRKHALIAFTVLVAALSAAALTVRVSPAEAATFAVNTTDDVNDGSCNAQHCSLREAINAANGNADTDTIRFNIPGPGPYSIQPTGGGLPVINFPVIVDATTQPGYSGTPIVELDGSAPGGFDGLSLRGGSSTVRGLVINRFDRVGIALLARGSYLIEDNYVGTDVTGIVALGNGEGGIALRREFFANTQNTIRRNVISGNVGHGILIGAGSLVQPAGENVIQGNYIGTNATGTTSLGNTLDGIFILAPSNLVGGTDAATRNVISGNGRHGVSMWGQGNANGNVVQGNFIGTAADGTRAVGNVSDGVRIVDSADNTIGGTAAGEGNVIAFNGGDGVLVGQNSNDSRWSRNGILSNSIFSNRGLGIDLILLGVTPNDPGDSDPGPNEHQNFPVLTGASGGTIAGTLNSKPNTTYRLEFFANPVCDPSGYGEGERLLGATAVTTDGNGNASFSFASPSPVLGGEFVSSTATDPANNTSEFSGCLLAEAGPPPPPPPKDSGTITIVKDAIPDGPEDFSFSGSGAIGSFSLDDDNDPALPDRRSFSGLDAGGYTVTEATRAGWNLTGLVCDDPDGGSSGSKETRTATIDLDAGETVTCTFTNTLRNRPPSCTGSASPSRLWPPNHKYVLVSVAGVTDRDGDAVTTTITGVSQDEPLNQVGDGDTAPDAKAGPAPNQVYVRAERSGLGDGRVYRIAYRATDGRGGECSGVATVGVPHDMGKGSTPIDSAPPSYDSFGS
ncbi:MAG: right-handed parallel beta-helix repeat-containing protein [Actinobacteria bacterium]|nr:right-handed parallel beta-helix repeat-containing protein [Actinomycetota bacterium]